MAMTANAPAQNAMILDHLQQNKAITPLEALSKYGSFRLAARIFDLRRAGHAIHTDRIPVGNRKNVASYTLIATNVGKGKN
jgi:hypothetical protein